MRETSEITGIRMYEGALNSKNGIGLGVPGGLGKFRSKRLANHASQIAPKSQPITYACGHPVNQQPPATIRRACIYYRKQLDHSSAAHPTTLGTTYSFNLHLVFVAGTHVP